MSARQLSLQMLALFFFSFWSIELKKKAAAN